VIIQAVTESAPSPRRFCSSSNAAYNLLA